MWSFSSLHTPAPPQSSTPGTRPPTQPLGQWSQWARLGVSKWGGVAGCCTERPRDTGGPSNSVTAVITPQESRSAYRVCAWPLLWALRGAVRRPPHLRMGPGSCTHSLLCQERFLLSAEVQLPGVPGVPQFVTVALARAWEESAGAAVRLDALPCWALTLVCWRLPYRQGTLREGAARLRLGLKISNGHLLVAGPVVGC